MEKTKILWLIKFKLILKMEYQKKINSINTQLFYLLPITLIFSNFLSNLIIFFITIYGLYLLDGNKLFFNYSSSSYPSGVDAGDNDSYTKQ